MSLNKKKKVSFVSPNYMQGPKELNAFFLPYSPGVLWSYSQQFDYITDKFELGELIWRRDKLDKTVETLLDSDIVGFSTYIWNKNYNYRVAERLKELRPEILIVFGGPEPPIEKSSFFKKFPYIDLCSKKEGELTFHEILTHYDSRDFTGIKGLLINNNTETIDTGDCDRISDLDIIPSPYLSGVFDKIVAENPDVTWNVICETNRGCPYQCTFCDWGSLTYNKIKKFNLERVFAELEWFGQNNCDYISIADANFGIFPERDSMIADKLIEVQNKYGKPRHYTMTWAKNQRTEVLNIAKRLIEKGKSNTGLNLSVQSLDDEVLNAIKRKNLEINKIEEIFSLCEENNIPLFTELILGLPNQTVEKFKNDFYRLFEIGNHTGITSWQAQLLENAEMNLLQRKLYKIESAEVNDYIMGTTVSENEIKEGIEIVIATKDLPREKMLEAQVFAWFIQTFHVHGLTNYISRYLNKADNINYATFYDKLFNFISLDPIFSSEIERIQNLYRSWASLGSINKHYIKDVEINGYNLMYSTIIKMHCEKLKDHFFSCVEKFLFDELKLEGEIYRQLLKFQYNYIIEYENAKEYPRVVEFDYDFLGYIQADTKLQNHVKYHFDFVENKDMSLHVFCESLYFGRRRNFGKAKLTKV